MDLESWAEFMVSASMSLPPSLYNYHIYNLSDLQYVAAMLPVYTREIF